MTLSKSGRPTMVDVAADAGVSLKTVSRVVNDVATVDPVLASRVHASVAKLGFRRNQVAASLRSGGETKTIGFITADLTNTFYSTLSSEIARIARERGYHVIMASSEEDPELERSTALDLCQRRVSGLIMVPASDDHSYLLPEIDGGIPVVFVDRPSQRISADSFLINNRDGTAHAVTQLISHGHTRIGFLFDSPAIFTMRQRRDGAIAAMSAANLPVDPELMATGVHTPRFAREAARAMLSLDDPPTALVCGNNRSLIGALEALTEIGDGGAGVEVLGFDDFELSHLVPHSLTLIAYDTAALGRRAAERLFDRIGGDTAPAILHYEPTELISRGLPLR